MHFIYCSKNVKNSHNSESLNVSGEELSYQYHLQIPALLWQ